ncbi:DUF1997 domain-containing protein [Oculatella sp. LEGE 06141]|uniref:DUF1997 domain-containing protein n=1 Tax=Oculatella sp. LEGE 06141 TaxID=1828648 RepID=UPI00187E337E|nr:DUF1997 domain-containing protein [Oculatella sp. LEGE 06141]MBE9177815.1 DUF1997 domain-containing protein [Oculatella sp. LEGE 06141]
MQANSAEHQPLDASKSILGVTSDFIDSHSSGVEDAARIGCEPSHFHGFFSSCMEMYADAQTVAQYLDAHRGWFQRCAHPMTAEPVGENGYALTIGRFGSFGYDVEPKIGLDLLPQEQGVYRIKTIPIPDYVPPGYEVDFQAALQLVQAETNLAEATSTLPSILTQVEWELNLTVSIQFPRFIQALPKSLIQTTGDRLLNQIVRQVSHRLTHKVQQDFHSVMDIPFPKKRKK